MDGVTRGQRIDWVDYAKGICIILVVMMHSTLGLEQATGQQGWMHNVVEFARPFRMPDFFLLSGLFLASVIDRDWKTYLDRKVVHFAYFYLLWMTIQFAFKAPALAQGEGVQDNPWNGVVMLSLWAPVNAAFVLMGWATLPFVSLALGFIGAAAVVRMGALMSRSSSFAFVRYCGEHSLIVYLAFSLPMATMRTILLKTGIITDLGMQALIVTAAGVAGP